jgi:hypothetical protein
MSPLEEFMIKMAQSNPQIAAAMADRQATQLLGGRDFNPANQDANVQTPMAPDPDKQMSRVLEAQIGSLMGSPNPGLQEEGQGLLHDAIMAPDRRQVFDKYQQYRVSADPEERSNTGLESLRRKRNIGIGYATDMLHALGG